MLTRLVCLLLGHRWLKTPYADADTGDGYLLRCRRCSKETEAAGSGVDWAGAGLWPQ